jgi:hypothetical protein
MEDPRPLFAQAVDLGKTRVTQFPGFILICGGPTIAEPGIPTSLRDYIMRHLSLAYPAAASRIVTPEELSDWATDSVYPNIFELEDHLAALASVIVIFVESPGSIAELGAFCLLKGVTDKLLVFVQERHFKQSSFIRLGPLRYLDQRNPRSVQTYPWETTGSGPTERIVEASVEPVRDEICKEIVSSHGASGINRAFVRGHGDEMLLICDLLNQLIGLKFQEIRQYLSLMGIDISSTKLKQFLYILDRLRMIEPVRRGHQQYYVPAVFDRYIRFGLKDGAPAYDRARFLMDVAEFYRREDPARAAALAPVLASM